MALIANFSKKSGASEFTISNLHCEANSSSANGPHTNGLEFNNIWTTMKVGTWTASANASASCTINGDSTTLWSSASPSTADIDISSYENITISMGCQGAFQSCSLSSIIFS